MKHMKISADSDEFNAHTEFKISQVISCFHMYKKLRGTHDLDIIARNNTVFVVVWWLQVPRMGLFCCLILPPVQSLCASSVTHAIVSTNYNKTKQNEAFSHRGSKTITKGVKIFINNFYTMSDCSKHHLTGAFRVTNTIREVLLLLLTFQRIALETYFWNGYFTVLLFKTFLKCYPLL